MFTYFLKTRVTLYFGLAFTVLGCSKLEDNGTISTEPTIDFVKTFGGSKNDVARAIVKTLDGGYAILGHTQSMDGDIVGKTNESFDFWLLKFTPNNTLQWQNTYGGSGDDRGNALIQTKDGGFALTGYTQSSDGQVSEHFGANDFWVLKTDSNGAILWQKTFGFLGADNGTSILQANDNGFLLTGVLDVTASEGQGNSKSAAKQHAGGDYWAIKLSASGEKLWSKYYGGTFTDTPYDVIQTEDNGYLIIGSSDSNDVDINNNKGTYDFWVVKISEHGNLLWEKSFGGTQIDEAYSITASNDGNYIIVGDTRSSDTNVNTNNGAADLWVIKISPSGELIWENTFGGTNFDVGRSISKLVDGGFLISGSSRSMEGDVLKNNGQNDAWVIKLDGNGKLQWQKSVGGSQIDFAYDAEELNNGNIIVVGESSSSNFDINNNKGFSDLLLFGIK